MSKIRSHWADAWYVRNSKGDEGGDRRRLPNLLLSSRVGTYKAGHPHGPRCGEQLRVIDYTSIDCMLEDGAAKLDVVADDDAGS